MKREEDLLRIMTYQRQKESLAADAERMKAEKKEMMLRKQEMERDLSTLKKAPKRKEEVKKVVEKTDSLLVSCQICTVKFDS